MSAYGNNVVQIACFGYRYRMHILETGQSTLTFEIHHVQFFLWFGSCVVLLKSKDVRVRLNTLRFKMS